MKCLKCNQENPSEALFCYHCGEKLDKVQKKNKKIWIIPITIVLVLTILTTTLVFYNMGNIRVPKKFNDKTLANLNSYEQQALDTFINELVDSYNQREKKPTDGYLEKTNFFNETEGFDVAFSTIKQLAQSNDYLDEAAQGGFLIWASLFYGAPTVDDIGESTSEELEKSIEERIRAIIEIYYE